MPENATPDSAAHVSTVAALMRVYPYARPAIPRIMLGVGFALIGAVVALAIPQVLRGLVDGPLSSGDRSAVVPAFVVVLALGTIEAVMIGLRRWSVLTPGTHIEARMRNTMYNDLQSLPVAFHDRWPSGQLLSRGTSDTNSIRRWISFGLVLLVVNIITVLIGLGFLVSISWQLGLLFAVLSIPLWIFSFQFEKRYSTVARKSQDQAGDLATAVEESVHGIRVLKAFGRSSHALANFSTQAEQLRGTELLKARAVASIWFWLLLVPRLTFAACLGVGVWLAAEGQLSVGDLVAFFATAAVLSWPVESIGFLLSLTLDARTAADRFFEVMDSTNTITDPTDPDTVSDSRGRLVFDDVHFRYSDSAPETRDLIDGMDLAIEPGETMALVGLTGSGKTTVTALTTRLYDVTGGAITIDGVDTRRLRLSELRSHIAMAFEDATLFSASVRDNVLLGRPDASDDDLVEALSIAQADFIYALPKGLDTAIGEEGLSLSGGQRQRLALARAVAASPSVLVLDDPLSALDVDTEALVEAALRRVLASTTALIVAHRPSTVMLADRVALMHEGRIVEVGTHSELLARSERYRYVISSLDDNDDDAQPPRQTVDEVRHEQTTQSQSPSAAAHSESGI